MYRSVTVHAVSCYILFRIKFVGEFGKPFSKSFTFWLPLCQMIFLSSTASMSSNQITSAIKFHFSLRTQFVEFIFVKCKRIYDEYTLVVNLVEI